jgi:hypothetical protein
VKRAGKPSASRQPANRLRHNGQEPADCLLGATRALAAAITVVVAERAERDKLERAMEKIIVDAAAVYI